LIILDTNVVSEPMKPESNGRVLRWLDRQPAETLFITAITLGELLLGIARLPDGRRKSAFSDKLGTLTSRLFLGRILPYDDKAANAYASLVSRARAEGYAVSIADAQIAAITIVHGCALATRDTRPFLAAGVKVINPWQD
jgi:predicted nucleic acid-binding protein